MRNRTKGLATALVLTASALTVAALTVGLASGVAAAQTTTSLSITSFNQIVADPASGYLFISSPEQSEILVTNLTGQQVATIGDQDGVEGLALSSDGGTLYAALGTSDAVTAISTSSLAQTASYSLPAGDAPQDVAVQSGDVWVSYNTGTAGEAAIGDINISASTPGFETQANMGGWYSAPEIAADPQDTGVLVAAVPGLDPAPVASYDVAVDPATVTDQENSFANCENETDLAVVPGGSDFILACGSPYAQDVYSTATLSQDGSYPTTTYPDAVAIDANGDVAAGTANGSASNPDLYVYQQGGGTPVNTYNLASSGGSVAPRGLAWNPDGSQLFVVDGEGSDSFALQVIAAPTLPASTLSLTGPSTADIGQAVTLTGSITIGSGTIPPSGTAISITRSESGSTTVQDFSASTDADGDFSLTDTPPATGQYTYTASYAGTTTSGPATASATVTVTLIPASLTLTGPSTAAIGHSVTLTGSLTLGGAAAAAGTAVTISRSETGSTTVKDFNVTTAAGGSFSLTDTPPGAGQFTYTASYAGTPTTAPATAEQTVSVALTPTSLTVTASPSTATYEPTIHVTAHLGKTGTNRTVSIYAETSGSTSRKLLKTAKVNASGNLAVSYRAAHSTTFTADFAGDADYASATATASVSVRAKVSETLSGYSRSKRIGGKTYRVFRRTNVLDVHVAVAPDKAGECVEFTLAIYYEGAWHSEGTTCGALSKSSKLTVRVSLKKAALGYHYRIRADYLPGDDTSNLGNDSAWAYFVVEK